MKYERIDGIRIKTRETWLDWLRMEVFEGEVVPPFHLPVKQNVNRLSYECWIFPLAPFVLLWKLLYSATWAVWCDIVRVLNFYNK